MIPAGDIINSFTVDHYPQVELCIPGTERVKGPALMRFLFQWGEADKKEESLERMYFLISYNAIKARKRKVEGLPYYLGAQRRFL